MIARKDKVWVRRYRAIAISDEPEVQRERMAAIEEVVHSIPKWAGAPLSDSTCGLPKLYDPPLVLVLGLAKILLEPI